MNERKMEFRLGVLVVAVVLIAAIMVLILGEPETFKPGDDMRVYFKNTGGVSVDSPVRNSGILIGRVTAVELAAGEGAVVTVRIYKKYKLLPNQTFKVAYTSVLGDVQLDVSLPAKGIERKVCKTAEHPEGETILLGEEPLDPMREVKDLSTDLTEALHAVTETGNSLNAFIKKSDAMLYGDELQPEEQKLNIAEIVKNLDETVKEAKQSFETINDIVGDEKTRENLKSALDALPDLVNNTNTAIGKMDTSFIKINDNLANLEQLTSRLGERGPAMVDNVDEALENVKNMTDTLSTLTSKLDHTGGTLGRLIHDDSLYHNINQASKNIRDITVKLKPIVNDVRVISDRMARHPGSIIRDAVSPGSGAKGLPGDVAPSQYVCPPDNGARGEGPALFNGPLFRMFQPEQSTGFR